MNREELHWLSSLVAQGPQALFATVSGAHLYGFESADSDYDLRGAFVAPLGQVLALRPYEETLSLLEIRDGRELDWVAHDLTKFARLMTRRNGYVLEQLMSPLVVQGGPWLEELREIGRGCLIRHLYHHYRGFASGQRRLLEGGDTTVKRLLYIYRVFLTGIHVLRSGEIQANVTQLAAEYQQSEVPELVERKRAGTEKGALEPGEAELHAKTFDRLESRLLTEFEASSLPEQVQTLDALSDYVVRARLELGQP